MKLFSRSAVLLAAVAAMLTLFCAHHAFGQNQARRLILKDGSYQSVTKYEVHGDRVRYYSAERGEWEEVPKSLVDWDATDKFEQGRKDGGLAPEAVELDKELEAERKAEQARSPQVAPGLRLPDEGGIFLLDTFENQPQLAELHQSGGDVEKTSKTNILRAAINPLAGAKQNIELPGPHAKIQSHSTVPSIYINVDPDQSAPPTATATPAAATSAASASNSASNNDRFKIIRIDLKNGKRFAGAVKIAVNGKMKTDERFVATTSAPMTGGWIKIAPTEPLPPGEYAVAEMLGTEGMNLYVWDFGVNPSAPANAFTWKPEPAEAQPKPDQPPELQKPEKQ
ncbi:MAG TPA: hypothetical protein VK828_03125 [Terriglobales bacterium]|nr:hypothetical protein [Terriglobales bacterium]